MLKCFSTRLSARNDVLGINARNLDFIYRLNVRKYLSTVDDKLLTKKLLNAGAVPTPPTLAIFRSHWELKDMEERIARLDGFAVKPAQGSGGRGIVIVRRDCDGGLIARELSDKTHVRMEDLKAHISRILSGLYSLEKLSDATFLEHLLEPEEVLAGISYGGVPDIRIIVHKGKPIMAMTRIPTRKSAGRANLHQGAFALGIDMDSGQTTHAVLGHRNIDRHPDTGKVLSSLMIPAWKNVVEMSRRAAGCVRLGYLGVDIVIDRYLGPLVVELNARPGLNIQLANKMGLVNRLYGG